MSFHNLAREYSTTTGTSNCVLSGAVPGCNTWDLAGVTNGESVRYGIITYSTTSNRPTHTEVGTGTYTTSTKTLARTTVESSTNGGSKITLTGLSEVFITPSATDLASIGGGGAQYAQFNSTTVDTVTNTSTQDPVVLNQTVENGDNLASLATNTLTINTAGWYQVVLVPAITNGSPPTPIGTGNILVAINAQSQGDYYGTTFPTHTSTNIITFRDEIVRHIQLAASDTITVRCTNNTGASITVGVTELTLTRLGA